MKWPHSDLKPVRKRTSVCLLNGNGLLYVITTPIEPRKEKLPSTKILLKHEF